MSRLRRALAESRSARAAATVAAGWCRTALAVALGLVCTPLTVRFLGGERYGAARLAEQWFAYLDFLYFGLGSAVGVLMMAAASSREPGAVGAVARAGARLLARQLRWVLPAAAGMVVAFPLAFDL